MFIKALFFALAAGILFPLAAFAILSDLTRKKSAALAAAAIFALSFYLFSLTPFYAACLSWLSQAWHPYLALFALGAVIAGSFIVAALLRRHADLELRWPRAMTVREMQRASMTYLRANGWQTEPMPQGFAGLSIYRCRKNDLRMFAVLSDGAFPLGRLISNLAKTPGLLMSHTVIILKSTPVDSLIATTSDIKVCVIGYRQLSEIDEICQAMEARHVAARARRKSK